MAVNLIQGKQIATASWAQNAVSASYSATASYALNAGGTTIDTGSFATTSSFNAFTSSYNTGSFTGSFTGDGVGLYNIPASGIIGLNLSQISSGSVSASISPENGLQVNTNVTATSFTGSLQGVASTSSFAPNYTTTSSFNSFTSSYYQDSSSFDTRIDNLEQFSSSLDSTFATDAQLNQATSSLSSSISSLSSSFLSFTASYNTGSFTGSFTGSLFGTSSWAENTQTASFLNTLNQNILLSGSLKFDPTQDPDPTGLDLDSTTLFQSSSNTTLGYDLYIRQNGNVVKWKWIEGVLETGLLYGGVVTYSDSNVFVSPGSGIIAEHNATTGSEIGPIVTYVTWNAITQSISNIATQQVTYLYIDSNGDLQQQSSRFTAQQYHDYIPLGAVGHFDNTQVSAFGGAVQTAYDQVSQISSFVDAFGPLKVSGYGLTGQAGTLQVSVGSGTSFIHGGFYENNPEYPSQITTPAQATASLARVYRSGSSVIFDTNGGNLYTTVNPTVYDRDGDGTLANVGSGNWSIQRVFTDPKTGVLYVYYGQERYTTLLNALQYLPTDPFTEGDTFDFTTFVGYLVLRGNASDLTDTSNNSVINGGLFRGSGQGSGGGIALSNLDDLTDVSINSPTNGQALVYNSGIWQNGIPTSASFALSSSRAVSSSFATSASFAISSSRALNANNATTASYALTSSVVQSIASNISNNASNRLLSATGGDNITTIPDVLYENLTLKISKNLKQADGIVREAQVYSVSDIASGVLTVGGDESEYFSTGSTLLVFNKDNNTVDYYAIQNVTYTNKTTITLIDTSISVNSNSLYVADIKYLQGNRGDSTQNLPINPAHAQGASAQALGSYSHAEGGSKDMGIPGGLTLADGSHAEGLHTIALGVGQHVQGQFNVPSTAQSAFIIGNGTDNDNRSNLVFASGSQFQVTGSIQVSGSIIAQGNITMPNRPAFRVTGASTSNISATTTISGSAVDVEFNQGNHYNLETGKFTAPIAGLYQVNVVCRTATNDNATINQIIVRKQLSGGGDTTAQIMLEWAKDTTVNHMGGSSIVSMAVGDTLRVDVTAGTIQFDGNDNFSVAYIG